MRNRIQPNEEQTFVHSPALGRHAVCMASVGWSQCCHVSASVCGWQWQAAFQWGITIEFQDTPVPLVCSEPPEWRQNRPSRLFLSSVGEVTHRASHHRWFLRDSGPPPHSTGVRDSGKGPRELAADASGHERENHGCSPTVGTHNDQNRKTWTPPAHFTPLPMG